VTKNPKLLIAIVAAVAALGAYWMLVLSPKREEISKLDGEIATAQADLSQTQSTLAEYQKAQSAYKTNYATVVRLGKAMPADDDVRSLLVQLNAAANHSNVDFDRITVGGSSGTPTQQSTTGKAGPPGSVTVANGGFTAMPFTFAFQGRYTNLQNFLSRLERFVTVSNDKINVTGRLLRLESLSLQADQKGFPYLTAEIGATSYLMPQTESTATAPAASDTAQASATPGSGPGTTPTTTTATSTGAIR
jgi:Tfp pilus assembly protein PilO